MPAAVRSRAVSTVDHGALAARLTGRDWWLAAMLAEHRVMTTPQLARIAFPSLRTATRRLATLRALGLIAPFRPWRPVGAADYHWTLTHAGAGVLATRLGIEPAAFGYRVEKIAALPTHPRLAHDVGCNDILTHLIAETRTSSGHQRLVAWWSARSAARQWGSYAQPDAYARWHTLTGIADQTGVALDFFLEYDTGTEPLTRVVAKLPGYAALAVATGITTPLLIVLPGPAREGHLHEQLRALTPTVPIATTHQPTGEQRWSAARWQAATSGKVGGTSQRRQSLAELAHRWPAAPTPADHADPTGPNDVLAMSAGAWQPPNPTPPPAQRAA